MSPKVSVVMSVYNGERYLREAIDSILNQTFTDFEFVIINDGSTDRTSEILQGYHDPRIKIVHNENNMGLSKSLNKGLKMAKGEYIARMDADDISLPERLERQVDFLNANPQVGLVATSWWNMGSKDMSLFAPPTAEMAIRWYLLFGTPVVHSSVMFKREIIGHIGPYDEGLRFARDYELWCRIAQVAKVGILPEPLVIFRVCHPNRISVQHLNEQWTHNCQTSIQNIRRLLGKSFIGDDRVRKLCGLIFLDPACSDWDLQAAEDLKLVLKHFLRCYRNSLTRADLKQIAGHLSRLASYHARVDASIEDWQIFRQIFLTMLREDLLLLKLPDAHRLFMWYLLGRTTTQCVRSVRSVACKYTQRLHCRLLSSFKQTRGEK